MKPVDNIIATHSYKEQSSGEGSSGGEYEFLPGEDYYYEEEQDNRPTVEKVHIQDSHTIFIYCLFIHRSCNKEVEKLEVNIIIIL